MFSRNVDRILEQADALRLGAQLIQQLLQRTSQLEKYIIDNKLEVPPPPAPVPTNVTPMKKR